MTVDGDEEGRNVSFCDLGLQPALEDRIIQLARYGIGTEYLCFQILKWGL
jgi:hypothetical protein